MLPSVHPAAGRLLSLVSAQVCESTLPEARPGAGRPARGYGVSQNRPQRLPSPGAQCRARTSMCAGRNQGRRGATWHTAALRSRGFVMRPGPHQPGDPGPCRGLQAAPGGVVPGTRAARAGPLLQALGVGSRGRDWPARSCGPILRSRHTAALPPSEAASRHSTAFVRRLRSRETASQRRSQKPSPPSTRPHTLHDTAPAASGPHARRAHPAGRTSVAGGGTLPSHREQVPPAGDRPAPSHTLTATEPAWPCQHAAAGGPFSWDSSGL